MSRRKIFYVVFVGLILLATLALGSSNAAAADSVWKAQYFNNKSLSGTPVLERDESNLNWDWGYGSPSNKVNVDDFSARWTRNVNFSAGNYRFAATMDDGMRVWVDDVLIIDAWKDGAVRTINADRYLGSGDHRIKVEYFDDDFMGFARLTWGPASPMTINNWRGEYFNNATLSGSPVAIRDDANVDFNWRDNSPISGVGIDNFSVRWTRSLVFQPGRHRFTARVDDGVRLWVNNQLIVDKWFPQTVQAHSGEIELGGGPATVKMEYYDRTGLAEAHLSWERLTSPPTGGGNVGTATVTGAYFLNVRSGPGLSNSIVTYVAHGSVLNLMGYRDAAGTWVLIGLANGTQGWIHAGYVRTSVPVSSLAVWSGQGGNGNSGQTGNATVNTAYLNVRSGPGISNGVIAVIARGTSLTLTHRNAGSSWVRAILPNGTQGWVNAGYLQSNIAINSLPIG